MSFLHAKPTTLGTDLSIKKKNPFRPFRLYPDSVGALRPWREPSAFSLTEVVIAMGVAAVAFTTIIGLFPLGLNMSKESYESTQAALIAQTILADLQDATSAKGGGKLIQMTGSNGFTTANYTIIPMSGASSLADRTIYLAYDQTVRADTSGSPIMVRPKAAAMGSEPSWFLKGTNGPVLLVKVLIRHSFLTGGPPSATSSANPQRVDVTVESPASAPATNRTQYVFTGLVRQT